MPKSAPVKQYRAACSEAIASSLGFDAERSSSSLGWCNLEMLSWRGEAEQCAYETSDDTVIIAHTGGTHKVSVELGCAGNQFQSRQGTLTVVPPGTAITWRVNGRVRSYSLHLSASCFGDLSNMTSRPLREFLPFRCGFHDSFLSSLIGTLVTEIAAPTQVGPLYAESLADCVALHLVRSAMRMKDSARAGRGLPAKVLQVVLDRIEAHLECGISLQELADSVHVSRGYFAKSFREVMGVSPHAYITQRRLSVAKVLLTSSDRPLCDIALSCGFASQAHFTAQFRLFTGQTPAKYRSLSH